MAQRDIHKITQKIENEDDFLHLIEESESKLIG